MQTRRIATDGLTQQVLEAGPENGKAPLVLLIHGFPELGISWRAQVQALAAAGFHAVAPDMRGYGGTDKPADLEDVSLIASEMLEVDVEIDDALLDLIRKRSNGVVRTIVSALDKIEKMAMASDARIIRLEDVDASELLHDVRRSR